MSQGTIQGSLTKLALAGYMLHGASPRFTLESSIRFPVGKLNKFLLEQVFNAFSSYLLGYLVGVVF